MSRSALWMDRAKKVIGFVVGICGALAILGVFFKIQKRPGYELYMMLGFYGEATAFVAMGVLQLLGLVVSTPSTHEPSGGNAPSGHGPASPPLQSPALLKEGAALSDEVAGVTGDLNALRAAVSDLRPALEAVQSGRLEAAAGTLLEAVEGMAGEMAASHSALRGTREHLEGFERRCAAFNAPAGRPDGLAGGGALNATASRNGATAKSNGAAARTNGSTV